MDQGLLYVVATPIGNLEDITLRALHVLKEVDAIVAEDTRHTQKLLQHYNIVKPLLSFFEPKEEEKLPGILESLKGGKNLALVTDAGTPTVSDPGFRLVRACVEAGIPVVPIPGASAALCALVASGLPTDRFFFAGYLPEKPGKRKKTMEDLKKLPHTLILYLSKWKASKQTEELAQILGDRRACLARELTKLHEEFWRGTLPELAKRLRQQKLRGEMTLVVEGVKSQVDKNFRYRRGYFKENLST
ncbi:MAG: 16S rRNA (cytidine(1402)-2'-O)-methyltransferase [Deltaproteobacteria bacterium]|nr:16S rRNA (cytidine(1402)-2'-O)-methyltransferase [Deltaproteobacteria bacterium]